MHQSLAIGRCLLAALILAAAPAVLAYSSGDGDYQPASATGIEISPKSNPVLSVASQPNSSTVGLTYTVSIGLTGASSPTGTIYILDGTSGCQITLPATSCDMASFSVGTKVLTASYYGDVNNSAAFGSSQHTVNKASPTLLISVSPNQSYIGQSFLVTAILINAWLPSGSILISDGTHTCQITLGMRCVLPSTTLGWSMLAATFAGDENNVGASLAGYPHLVLPVSDSDVCAQADITLSTQSEVNAFQSTYGPCKSVQGGLAIGGDDITDLTPLTALVSIGGTLYVSGNPLLASLAGLDHITQIRGSLFMSGNASLASAGLTQLTFVTSMEISYNDQLTSVDGLPDLVETYSIHIEHNANLTNVSLPALTSGTSPFAATLSGITILDNPSLTSVRLTGVTKLVNQLEIDANPALVTLALDSLVSTLGVKLTNNLKLGSIAGLRALLSVNGPLQITGNPHLASCSGIFRLVDGIDDAAPGPGPGVDNVPDVSGAIDLGNNRTGCSSIDEIRTHVFTDGFEP